MEKFTSSQEEQNTMKEEEFDGRVNEMKQRLLQEFHDEKKKITETHDEELKIVATHLVQVNEDKQKLYEEKEELKLELRAASDQKERELSDLKTLLITQHMAKFEEVTAAL